MKLISAPLANISHAGFRMLIHTFGDPDEYFTEMIHAPSLLSGGPFEQWYLRTNPVPEKLVWQLTASKAEAFAHAIPLVLQEGGIGIDLNMGCSAPPIVRSGAGFAWMLKPLEETAAAVRLVKNALERYAASKSRHFRLSVKLRLGTSADYPALLRFCRMLEDEGVQLITLHPRFQRQRYGRPARHEYIGALAADLHVPVYGNGDINSAETFLTAARQIPCAGWMIGRAAVQMPWIFKAISLKCVTDSERKPYRIDLEETAIHFLHLLTTEQPPSFYRTRIQRFFQFYCDNFSFAHYCRTRLLKAAFPEEAAEILRVYFEQVPEDKIIEL